MGYKVICLVVVLSIVSLSCRNELSEIYVSATGEAAGTGTVDITVSTPYGTSATSVNDQFTYASVPTVTGRSPTSGPAAGGTTVIVSGTGFTGATVVKFGGIANATGAMTVNNANQITVTSPAGTGTVDITVTTPGGTSPTSVNDQFTYAPVPAVSGRSPTSGPAAGGTSVTLSGTGFTGATVVKFGGIANATGAMTVNSDTQITVTSPAGTGTVDITVTSLGGTSTTSVNDQFTYVPAPTFSSISPATGSTLGATSVTIIGTNFVSSGSFGVTIGGAAATVTGVSTTSISATTPSGTAGARDVVITNNDGQNATGAGAYTYVVLPPTFSSITPNSGPTTGLTPATIAGANFDTGGSPGSLFGVTIGGATATILTVSATEIKVGTPPSGTAGAKDVVITNFDNQKATGTGAYTYVTPAPTITNIAPNSGSTAGGLPAVIITGTDFTGATAVTFGGTGATAFTVNSATQITATAPAHSAGAVNVVVTTPGGTATRTYTYVAPPSVTGITPATGNRGWPVSITNLAGSGFQSGATVKLTKSGNSDIVATVVTITSTQITCTFNLAGAAPGAWNVVVTNSDLQSGTLVNGFTVNSPIPVLSTRNPTTGTRGWPVTITSITGTGFQPGATVLIRRSGYSDVVATGVNVASPTSINAGTLNLLGVTAGSWYYVVINTDGQASTSTTQTFTVTNTVTVTSITPVSGRHGYTVTITNIGGTGFQPGVTQVRFSRNTGTQRQILLTNINVISSTQISGTLVIPSTQTAETLYVRVTNADATTGISSSRIFTVLT